MLGGHGGDERQSLQYGACRGRMVKGGAQKPGNQGAEQAQRYRRALGRGRCTCSLRSRLLPRPRCRHGCPQRQGGQGETQEGLATPAQHGVDAGLGAAAAQLSIPQMRTRNVACQACGLGPASSHPSRHHHVCLLHREEPQGNPVLEQVSVPAPPPERAARRCDSAVCGCGQLTGT